MARKEGLNLPFLLGGRRDGVGALCSLWANLCLLLSKQALLALAFSMFFCDSTRKRRYCYNLETRISSWNHPVSSRLVPGPLASHLSVSPARLPSFCCSDGVLRYLMLAVGLENPLIGLKLASFFCTLFPLPCVQFCDDTFVFCLMPFPLHDLQILQRNPTEACAHVHEMMQLFCKGEHFSVKWKSREVARGLIPCYNRHVMKKS